MVLAIIIMSIISIILIIFGYLIWIKEKISLLHVYHYNRVSEEDKKAFCTLSGIGIIIIGIGIFITSILMIIINSSWSFISFFVGFIIGLSILIYAGLKYN